MTLRDLFGSEQPPVAVSALALDDRAVAPGTVFFCVPGFTRDGHDFAATAVERGACALVVQRPIANGELAGVPQILVPDVRAAMAPAAAALHGDPTASLVTAGITGTNGKTTTAYLLRALLEAGGHRTGLLGTVSSVVGGVKQPTQRTTPEAIDLQRTFAAMLAGGDTHCVMEVSSHALELRRADAIHWAVALFTNLSQDHLDFHVDMERYFAAKQRLFAAAEGPSVVNVDDRYGRRLADELRRAGSVLTVGLEQGAAVRATDVSFGPAGSDFTLDGVRLHAPLPGRFNVVNVLGAIAAARVLGVTDATIAAALPDAGHAPGRFEPVDEGQEFAVIVDYAHTPDGLENVLRAARQLAGDGRVLAVFGAGGDRDRGKRPLMGAVAAALADRVIVTSDNPRSEDPEAIVADVLGGAGPEATVLVDRRTAIEHAVRAARPGDVVVIAGKGHEQGQELADGRKEPFDDVAVARDALRDRVGA